MAWPSPQCIANVMFVLSLHIGRTRRDCIAISQYPHRDSYLPSSIWNPTRNYVVTWRHEVSARDGSVKVKLHLSQRDKQNWYKLIVRVVCKTDRTEPHLLYVHQMCKCVAYGVVSSLLSPLCEEVRQTTDTHYPARTVCRNGCFR